MRALHKRMWRGFSPKMTVFGIALSVAALWLTLSVAQGFEREFQKALLHFYAHLTVPADPGFSLSAGEVRRALDQIGEGSARVKPFLYREALLIHEGKIFGVVLKGEEGIQGLQLGEALAEKLGATRRETVKFMLPSQKTVRLRPKGTFRTGLHEIDSQFAKIGLEELRKLFELPAGTRGYEIFLSDPSRAQEISQRLMEVLPPFVGVQNWIDTNRPLWEAFQLEKWFFRLLIGFMAVTSLLNIVSAVSLSIFHQKRKIALLQALGLTRRRVRRLFAAEGAVLGLAGILLGLLAAGGVGFSLKHFQWLAIDPEVYFLEKLPIDFAMIDGLMIFLAGLAAASAIAWMAAGGIRAVSIREGLQDVT